VIINYDIPWNPTRILQRVGRINRVGTSFSEIHIFNFFPVEKTESEIGLEAAAVAKLQAFHEALGEDAKYLTEEEETSPRGLFDRINAPPEEEDDTSLLYYIKELQRIKEEQPELFERIKRLPKKARSSRYWNRNFLVTLLKKGNVKKIFICYEGKKAQEIDFLQAVELLKVEKDEKRAPLNRELFYHLLSENIKAFEEELNQSHVKTRGGTKSYEMRLAKELGALKKLVSKEERKIINHFLDLIRESGLPQATAKKVFSALSSEKEVGEKVKILENFLREYAEDMNNEPSENFKQQRNNRMK
jgi:superfamily II DNA/RNA helicase